MAVRLLGLVAGLVTFAVVHSVLAAPRVRERGEALLGSPVRYRFLYSVVAAVLLTAVLVATRGSYPIVWEAHGLVRAALLAVQGIAVIGFILTVRSFAVRPFLGLRARSTAGGAGVAPEFRVHGPYARCRHPLYFFTNLFFSAWPVMDLRWLIVALWLWGYAYVGSILEERKLVQELGDAYRAYQVRMPRFLPLGPRRGRPADRR
jgi:protein-S-isoprenylcysteine O-methyltransferase Ste14